MHQLLELAGWQGGPAAAPQLGCDGRFWWYVFGGAFVKREKVCRSMAQRLSAGITVLVSAKQHNAGIILMFNSAQYTLSLFVLFLSAPIESIHLYISMAPPTKAAAPTMTAF